MNGFELSAEQLAARKWAHEFAEREIRPVAARYDETEEFPWPVLRKAAGVGLYGLDFYGMVMADESGLVQPLVVEEIAWGCAGIALAVFGSGLPLAAIFSTGTPDQFARWAPECFGTAEEPNVAAFCVTEAQAGSDVSSLRTSATRDGPDWVLNGRKVFITNGGIAAVHVVVATVDPALGHRGQASFVVPPGTPGLTPGHRERKLGVRASHTAEVILEDCRVSADCLLGGEEQLRARLERGRRLRAEAEGAGSGLGRPTGGSGALRTFERTRPVVATQALGVARAAFEYARDYARERTQFGKPIAAQQAVAFKLADMATEIDATRLLVWRASWMARSGAPFDHAEGSMSKLKAGEVAVRVTDDAIQILGGYGYVRDFPVEKWHRDAKIYTLFEGTSEIQRLVIARANGGLA